MVPLAGESGRPESAATSCRCSTRSRTDAGLASLPSDGGRTASRPAGRGRRTAASSAGAAETGRRARRPGARSRPGQLGEQRRGRRRSRPRASGHQRSAPSCRSRPSMATRTASSAASRQVDRGADRDRVGLPAERRRQHAVRAAGGREHRGLGGRAAARRHSSPDSSRSGSRITRSPSAPSRAAGRRRVEASASARAAAYDAATPPTPPVTSRISASWSTVMTSPGRSTVSQSRWPGGGGTNRSSSSSTGSGSTRRPARPAGPSPPRPAPSTLRSIAAISALTRSTSSACCVEGGGGVVVQVGGAPQRADLVRAPGPASRRPRAPPRAPPRRRREQRVGLGSAAPSPWPRMVRASPRIASVSPYMPGDLPACRRAGRKPAVRATVESRPAPPR